jgi:TatD DNase family protein
MLIDTHAHLADRQFDADLDEVLARADVAGVDAVIDVGEGLASSRRCVEHAGKYPRVYASVGVHPNNAGRAGDTEIEGVAGLADAPKVVAIGETGLDHYRPWAPHARQEAVFRASLRIAADKGLPVIMHCRRAYAALIAVLREMGGNRSAGVLHCFSGNWSDAEALVDMGYYISVGGPLTYPGSGGLRELVRRLPMERIIVETDCPYLPPQPMRGRRNEPAQVVAVAKELARVRGIAVEEVAAVTTENARRLFSKMQLSSYRAIE